jgi:hypothetical protein
MVSLTEGRKGWVLHLFKWHTAYFFWTLSRGQLCMSRATYLILRPSCQTVHLTCLSPRTLQISRHRDSAQADLTLTLVQSAGPSSVL